MKKISIAVTAFLTVSSVYATGTTVCSAPATAGDGTPIVNNGTSSTGFSPANSGTTPFVINNFTPKCSANVYAAFEQTEIAAGVAAGSKKGKNLFSGSTNGGGVKPTGTTYANGVSETNAQGATADQLTPSSN
jgi:hypothetical protein